MNEEALACYTKFRAQCASDAALFEAAAERARSVGTASGMGLAHILSDHAIKLRYLSEFDPEVALPYETEARR